MQSKKKKSLEKNSYSIVGFLRIVLILIGILVAMVALIFVYNRRQANNLFIDYETTDAVYQLLIAQFPIGETTQTQVEQHIEDGSLGSIYCYPDLTLEQIGGDESAIICEALESYGAYGLIFHTFYVMIFYFENEILSAIEVDTSVNVT